MKQSKVAYTVEEFCSLYGIGRSFAYEEIKAGNLKIRKAGRRTLCGMSDPVTTAAQWLSEQSETLENKFTVIHQRFGLKAAQAAQALTMANKFRTLRRAHG